MVTKRVEEEGKYHPSLFSPIQGHGDLLESIPALFGRKAGVTPWTVHHRATHRQTTMHTHNHSYWQFRITS